MDSENKEKFETINRLLDGEYILAHIDSSHPRVSIPDNLKSQEALTLKFSRLFKGGVELKPDSLEANLLFNGRYFLCVIPLDAIWGVTGDSGSNLVWPAKVPPEILKNMTPVPPAAEGKGEEKEKKEVRKSHLTRVK